MACQLITLAYWTTHLVALLHVYLLFCSLGAVVYSYCFQLCLLKEVIACFAIGKVRQLDWNTATCSNLILGAHRGHWILLRGWAKLENSLNLTWNSGELFKSGEALFSAAPAVPRRMEEQAHPFFFLESSLVCLCQVGGNGTCRAHITMNFAFQDSIIAGTSGARMCRLLCPV